HRRRARRVVGLRARPGTADRVHHRPDALLRPEQVGRRPAGARHLRVQRILGPAARSSARCRHLRLGEEGRRRRRQFDALDAGATRRTRRQSDDDDGSAQCAVDAAGGTLRRPGAGVGVAGASGRAVRLGRSAAGRAGHARARGRQRLRDSPGRTGGRGNPGRRLRRGGLTPRVAHGSSRERYRQPGRRAVRTAEVKEQGRLAALLILRQCAEVFVHQRPIPDGCIVAAGEVELVARRVGPAPQFELKPLEPVEGGRRQLLEAARRAVAAAGAHLAQRAQHFVDNAQVLGRAAGFLQLAPQLLGVGRQPAGRAAPLAAVVAAAEAGARIRTEGVVGERAAEGLTQALAARTSSAAALLSSLPPGHLLARLALLTPLALLATLPLLAALTLLAILTLLAVLPLLTGLALLTALPGSGLLGHLPHLLLERTEAAGQIGRLPRRSPQTFTAFGIA